MKKAMEILGAAAAAATGGASTALVPTQAAPVALSDKKRVAYMLAPAVAGGLAGYLLWKKHPVLGVLAGASVGGSAYSLVKGGPNNARTNALCNMAGVAAGVVGSLKWKKHPVLGYFAGGLAVGVATAFVPGSTNYNFRKSLSA